MWYCSFWNISVGDGKNDIHKVFVFDLAFNFSAGPFLFFTGSKKIRPYKPVKWTNIPLEFTECLNIDSDKNSWLINILI